MAKTKDEPTNAHESTFGKLIYGYSRAQAIEDRVLIDVTRLAMDAGFRFPVAMTSAAWNKTVPVPDEADWQDETGRLWDVLNVLRFAIRANSGSQASFTVSVQNAPDKHEDVFLKALCGPGDNAEPVITIMLPEED